MCLKMSEKKFQYLVADTTAFINNVQLQDYSEKVLTVSDVVNEVKNKRQIRRLVVLPFDLEIREPNDESFKFVTSFAKKTGDYASLSAIDLKVIALTYELEKQHVGVDHLRTEPMVSKLIASKSKPEELVDKNPLAGFYIPKESQHEEGKEGEDSNEKGDEIQLNICPDNLNESISKSIESEQSDEKDQKTSQKSESEIEHLGKEMENLLDSENETVPKDSFSSDDADDEAVLDEVDLENNIDLILPSTKETDASKNPGNNDADGDGQDESTSEEDDEDSWITPSNVKQVKKDFRDEDEDDKTVIVACMTTDYALQNVLRQINLNIASLNGKVIKQLRTYILRCYACFKTTSIITKVFCPNCGNKTLKKVAVSLDENGQQVIHINTRRPLTKKYKNQSLPRPHGGKHSCNPIIVEDQPIPKQFPSRVAKTKLNPLDEDYIAGLSPFAMRDVDSKSALLRGKGNIKQWARNNLYEEERRGKRSNRFKK